LAKGRKFKQETLVMAIIPLYYVVAGSYDIDPDTKDIAEGACVALNKAAGARRVESGDEGRVLGLAGDTKSSSASSSPGVGTGWQNRVSDGYNETKASGKLTVYHGGGEFVTDQFIDDGSITVDNVGYYLKSDAYGKLALDAGGTAKTANTVAQLVAPPSLYPSGVPGTDINQDSALAGVNYDGANAAVVPSDNYYIVVKLLV
jgi:hypothetical protein